MTAEHNADYVRPICAEEAFRGGLSDEEFWEHVYRAWTGHGPDHDIPEDVEQTTNYGQPCPVCHELGACGYDAEGRALIHVREDDDG